MPKFCRLTEQRNFTCYVEKTRLPGSENAHNLVLFRGTKVPFQKAILILENEYADALNDEQASEVLSETYELYELYMLPFAEALLDQEGKDPKVFIAIHFLGINNPELKIEMGEWVVVSHINQKNVENELSFIELYDFWTKADHTMIAENLWNPTRIRMFLSGNLSLSRKENGEWQQTKANLKQKSKPASSDSAMAL